MGGSRGGTGPPWKITKIHGFLAILMQDPLKITKLPSHHSIVGHYRRAAGRPMMAHLSGISIISPSHQQQKKKKKKKTHKKTTSTPSDKTFWIRAWECVTGKYFSSFSTKTYVVGTQKNRLDETVLLSIQNICQKVWVRKYLEFHAGNFLSILTYHKQHPLVCPVNRHQMSRPFSQECVTEK